MAADHDLVALLLVVMSGERSHSALARLSRSGALTTELVTYQGLVVRVQATYFLWNRVPLTTTVTARLNPNRRYLITGGLVGTSSDRFAQIYIWGTCRYSGNDQILCGIMEEDPNPQVSIEHMRLNRTLPLGTYRVTIALRSEGGLHRGEGVIYDIT